MRGSVPFLRTMLLVLIATLGLAVLVSGCSWPQVAGPSPVVQEEPAVPVTTVRITTGPLQDAISFWGMLEPASRVTVATEVPGRIVQLVRVGQQVKAGDIVAVLRSEELVLQVRQAEAALETARTQLAKLERGATEEDLRLARARVDQARANLAGAERAYSDALQAYTDPRPVRQQVETAETQRRLAELNLQQAEARLAELRAGASAEDIERADLAVQSAEAGVKAAILKLASLETRYDEVDERYQNAADEQKPALKAELFQLEQAILAAQAQKEQAELAKKEAEAAYRRLVRGATASQIRQAELAVEQARTSLAGAQEALRFAREEQDDPTALRVQVEAAWTRFQIARSELEAAEAQLAKALAGASSEDLALARIAVAQAETALELARTQAAKLTIRAPVTAEVAVAHVAEGELAGPGKGLATLVATNLIVARIEVPPYQVGRIRVGSPAAVSVDGIPGEVLPATVTAIGPAALGPERTFPVEVTVENPSYLRPGMFSTVRVILAERDGVLLPHRALVERNERLVVFTVEESRAREKEIRTGIRDAEFVEVLAGLQPGDEVVISGQELLRDGTKVLPVPPADGTGTVR